MAIQIWNGSSWVTSEDPEVFSGGLWTNVQKGEVYTSTGWQVFYLRILPAVPTITLGSRTSSSITVNVSVPTGSPYKTQVTIWRVAGVETNIPSSPAVGEISSTYTQSGLSVGTSYTFSAYTKYYDPTTNELVAQSSTTTFTASTLSTIITAPTITLNSRTVSAITVNVTLPTGSPYKTQITVYRTDNVLGASFVPVTAAVGAISGTKTETGLSANASYQFSAYATYYDATTNEQIGQSATVTASFSTLAYIITTPTTPVNSARTTSSLSFQSTSNANYTRNGSAAYIEFEFDRLDIFSTWEYWTTINRGLIANDSDQTPTATMTNLNSGDIFRCRARTVYSDIGQISNWSSYSSPVQTKYYATRYVPSNTGHSAANNSSSFSAYAISGTSFKDANRTYAKGSDGDTGTEWMSDPLTTATVPTNETRTINKFSRENTFGVATYYTSAAHNLPLNTNTTNYSSVSMSSLIYSNIGLYTDNLYIVIEITGTAPATFGGTVTISGASGTNASYFNGDWTINQVGTNGSNRRIRISRPSSVPANIYPSGSKGSSLFKGTVNNVSVSSLGGGPAESSIYTSSSTTSFTRLEAYGGSIAETSAAGSVTYTVYSNQTVAKTSPNNETLRIAVSPDLPAGATNVQLESIQTRCGGVATPRIEFNINNGTATRILASGLSANATDTWAVPSSIQPNQTSLGVSNCWYITLTVRSGASGNYLYSTISEVQIRYSYTELV